MSEQILHMQELNENKVNVDFIQKIQFSIAYSLQEKQLSFQNKTI